jgi:hypothetical protein
LILNLVFRDVEGDIKRLLFISPVLAADVFAVAPLHRRHSRRFDAAASKARRIAESSISSYAAWR